MNNVNNQTHPKPKGNSFLNKLFSLITLYCLSFLILIFKIDLQKTKTNQIKDTYYYSSPSSRRSSQKKTYKKSRPIVTAYIETINQTKWDIKPLPPRLNAHFTKLKKHTYPNINSCTNLPSQLPVDDPPTDQDPFLPWLHDIFPSNDGTKIIFIAQNKRRCHTGSGYEELKNFMQPQLSLFQHVPVKRIKNGYRLSSHEEADVEQTRFICRFKPTNQETFSEFHVDYTYATFKKRGRYTSLFNRNGKDYNNLWNSQLVFYCPVPEELWDAVRSGESVVGDYATMFVDLIPIRTPPRYGRSDEFLPLKYKIPNTFNATYEYGNHILPFIEDSGRWENIPICKPSVLTYYDKSSSSSTKEDGSSINHTLVAFTWTSKSFKTRKSATLSDGERRLKEWITFHLLIGFDHIYIYDNTHAFDNTTCLQSITSTFPSNKVTRINWPAKVCNNNPSGHDDKGERSSQYAAEVSCLMRFGSSTKWMATLDIDEYLIPMGEYTDMRQVLEMLEKEDVGIYTFTSFRSRPIMSRLEPPNAVKCFGKRRCFQPTIPNNSSFLHTYNCEHEKPPKKKTVPAEKQIYRTDYVLLHFIHYSTITTEHLNPDDKNSKYRLKERKSDELTEATMIHTKTVPFEHTTNFEFLGKHVKSYFGFPWPDGIESKKNITNKDGFLYNCFINEHVESYWLPKLHKALGIIN